MNRLLKLTAVCLSCLAVFTGCNKKSKTKDSSSEIVTTAVFTVAETVTSTAEKTTSATTSVKVTTSAKQTDSQPDPLGNDAFSYNDAGAVVFSESLAAQDDATLISAAQKLFESACRTQWDFCCSCPYELDYNTSIENEFGWIYYKVCDDENVTSVSDVIMDYHKVFSERYPEPDFSAYRDESDGLYVMPSGRGAHLYYSASKITGIQSRTDDEIFFSVENYYDGTDFGEEAYSEEDVFSAVVVGDTLFAGQFTLPF